MDVYTSKIAKCFNFFFNNTGEPEYAVTLGQTTYYTCDPRIISKGWRAHEDKHKEQWRRDGPFKFLRRYLWQWIWKSYWEIDYEAEAREAANMA